MLKKILSLFFIFYLGILGGIWAQAFLLPYFASHAPFHNWGFVKEWNARTTVIREVKEFVVNQDQALELTVARVEKVVVGVKSTNGIRTIEGSGFIVTSDGFILTLASIVPQGYTVMISLNQEEEALEAQVLKRDVQKDLALLEIKKNGLQTTSFAGEEDVKLGMTVLLLGKIFEGNELITIVNKGVVKALSEDRVRTTIFEKTILEGSPLFDIEGKVLGLNVIDREGKVTAIPVSALRSFSGL
ncbi:trypsin-like peptidase domain-containing protein [Patescibacteria group bacterium]|nr:trypsin-like peptidase domain-containing protein [Patescibacteria group bacterium]